MENTNNPKSVPPLGGTSWHSLDRAAVLTMLKANEGGLSSGEAAARLRDRGPNILPSKPRPAAWQIVLRQFKSPLIYVLAAAAVVSAVVGDLKDSIFIAFVLGANAAIGAYQEWRAEKSSAALQNLLRIRAAVLRDGEVAEVDAEALVPGDIVWLESGNRVPADIRLLETTGFEVDESLLTGESMAVSKTAAALVPAESGLADRADMAHAGSVVQRGRGKGVVAETGRGTAIGALADHIVFAPDTVPPLLKRMTAFSLGITIALSVVSVLLGLYGILVQGRGLEEMFFFVVALAVSAIPEGLPAALAVVLSIATNRMARRGVIVRRLPAVEGLGSCTLVASDKTGTLTCNELTVREVRLADGSVLEVTGEGFAPSGSVLRDGIPIEAEGPALIAFVHAAVLCNEGDLHRDRDGWAWRGDPTDVALLAFAHKLGSKRETALAAHPQVNRIPYEPERRFAASYHSTEGTVRVFVKGAPEKILPMCGLDHDGAEGRMAIAMAARGFRVLALAKGSSEPDLAADDLPAEPAGLDFLGLVGMIDPLRPGVREAVAACRTAGVLVWMVTGDHPVTALAIARDLGLAEEEHQVITGRDLQELAPDRLPEVLRTARVFARVAPDQKLRLVDAAKAGGHFVAVTGDGINDAPALRAAHIGVAMGKGGTDVAREAAELVLTDDNFASVVAGIEEGRLAYKNIRNVITLLISTGAAEVTIASLSMVAGLPLPLLPVQLLWLNLATNGIQHLGLAFEPGQGDELRIRPRPPSEPIFNRLMVERVLISALVMGGLGFFVFRWMLERGMSEGSARNVLLLFMVLFENVHVGNCRSETVSAFRLSPLRSPFLLISTVAAFLLHLAMLYLPWGQTILGTEPVGLEIWAILLPLALMVFFVVEVHKWTWRRFRM